MMRPKAGLHDYAKAGNAACLAGLLLDGHDPNALDANNKTALHIAAENNHADCVKMLLAGGADPGIKIPHRKFDENPACDAALHIAAHHDNALQDMPDTINLTKLPEDVLRLIAYHVPLHDIAALSETSRKMHQAITTSKFWRAKLAQHFPRTAGRFDGTSVTQANFAAAYKQHYGTLFARTRRLFVLVAEGNLTDLRRGGQAPMNLDDMTQSYEVCGELLDIIQIACRQSYQSILDYGYSLVQARFDERGAESASQQLNRYGWQLIHYASAMNQSQDTICALLEGGADVNAVVQHGETPLYIAVRYGNTVCVKTLLAYGADVTVTSSSNVTLLYIAARHGYAAIVEQILAAGVPAHQEDPGGMTPLHIAAQGGHMACVEVLLAKGAPVNATTHRGVTPLYSAAISGNVALVEGLLEKGAAVNAALDNGMTPLYIAAEKGHEACVKVLLANGGSYGDRARRRFGRSV